MHVTPAHTAHPDPWDAWGEEGESSWLLSYVDILSLILALMVVLLGHTAAHQMATERQRTDTPAKLAQVTPPPSQKPSPPPKPSLPPTPLSVAAALLESPPSTPPAPLEPLPLRVKPLAIELPPEEPRVFEVVTREAAPTPVTNELVGPPAPSPEEQLAAMVEARFPDGLIKALHSDHEVSLEIADTVLFPSAQADLAPEALPVLIRLAQTLRDAGEIRIAVEGHTDNRPIRGGRFNSNWELSAARAAAVTKYLVQQGLDPARLRSIGYADTHPVADNGDAIGRALNRRVNLVVEFDPPEPATDEAPASTKKGPT